MAELKAGAKRSHWMWFVFPQLAGLGRSSTAQHFALANEAEARAYLSHSILGPRLLECTEAMLGWAGRRDVDAILGSIDALKFASSMTLFAEVAARDASPFHSAIAAFHGGQPDALTLKLLGKDG